jgi:hypothetical protein
LTPQEIFNTAYLNVIAQGRQSVTEKGDCRYRGPDGLKCAIGFMIDDATAEKWEGIGIFAVNKFGTPPDWVVDNMNLLIMIQDAHDQETDPEDFVEDFKFRMESVARNFKLEIPA